MKTIRLIELFAGYGSQAMALKRLGLPFEHHFVCEFDKYAIASYNAVHGTDYEPIDVKDVRAADLKIEDKDKYTYLLTYSFPCTDLSVCGKKRGMTRGSGTRSGLLWEVERILTECGDNLPQFLMMENVPLVHGVANIDDFNEWISFLDSLGYKSKWKDLNAKDYGVAQYRDRCFMISWLESGFCYQFPQPFPLKKTMRDYLDEEVDEKYYLKSQRAEKLIKELQSSEIIKRERETIDLNLNRVKTRTISTSIKTIQRGVETRQNKEVGVCEVTHPRLIGGLGEKNSNKGTQYYQQDRVYSSDGIAMSQPASLTNGSYNYAIPNEKIFRIRRLTEIECLRLMGVSEEDAHKIRSVNSAAQTYKQAGNSIVVDVMVAIFDNLFNDKDEMPGQMTIYDYL